MVLITGYLKRVCLHSFIILFQIFTDNIVTVSFVHSVMAERKSEWSEITRVQSEMLDCIACTKDEISDCLMLLQQYLEDNSDTAEYEKLETLHKKLRMVALLCCGVQDYILEIYILPTVTCKKKKRRTFLLFLFMSNRKDFFFKKLVLI